MSDFVVHEIDPDVAVRSVGTMPDLPASLDQEVERLWRAARDRVEAGGAGRLFNGRVFTIDRIAPDRIEGHLTEYRRLVAQMERHDLFDDLRIRSLSSCGILLGPFGVAIGRRPAAAIYQAGMWQLAPAGSVDAQAVRADGIVDIAEHVLREASEELGLPPEAIGKPVPLCIQEDLGSHVSDCGILLPTDWSGDAVRAAHAMRGDNEYRDLRLVAAADIPAFVAQADDSLVPPAREYLRRLGLLPDSLAVSP